VESPIGSEEVRSAHAFQFFTTYSRGTRGAHTHHYLRRHKATMRGHNVDRSSEAIEERDDSLREDFEKLQLHPDPVMFSPENVSFVTARLGTNDDVYKTSSSSSAAATTPMTAAITPMTPSPLPSPQRLSQRHLSSPAVLESSSLNGIVGRTAQHTTSMDMTPNNVLSSWNSPGAHFSQLQQGYPASPDNSFSPDPVPNRRLFQGHLHQNQSIDGHDDGTDVVHRQSWSTMDQQPPTSRLSSRRHRVSQSNLQIEDQQHPQPVLGISERRKSSIRGRSSPNSGNELSSSSSENSPSTSPKATANTLRRSSSRVHTHRRSSSAILMPDSIEKRPRSRQTLIITWTMIFMTLSSAGMIWFMNASLTDTAAEREMLMYVPTRHDLHHHHHSDAGLRGKLVQSVGRHEVKPKKDDKHREKKKSSSHTKKTNAIPKTKKKDSEKLTEKLESGNSVGAQHIAGDILGMALPPKIKTPSPKFKATDSSLYSARKSIQNGSNRVVVLDESVRRHPDLPHHRRVKTYPADFTDNTQLYPILDSSDERLARMERREPYSEGECVPMKEWQTTFYPVCNGMHELGVEYLGEENGDDALLFGTKGYWRNAWKLDLEAGAQSRSERDTVVLKTLR
jgi:hypothetical protein